MENKQAKDLLHKFNSGTCTEEERALLESWYLEWQGEEIDLTGTELDAIKSQSWRRIASAAEKSPRFSNWRRYAAAVLALALAGVMFLLVQHHRSGPASGQQQAVAISRLKATPGNSKVLLTLADGRVVSLDEAKAGKIAEVSGVLIRKTADGQLVYEATASAGTPPKQGASAGFNQIATPRGGQHKIILPDGTKVWLNAASSLKYPVQFTGDARRVELLGEGYFEVNSLPSGPGKRMPFLVSTPTQTVEVLGTHFNINAYEDEAAVKTTLLEGAVKISLHGAGMENPGAGNEGVLLKPGQQAVVRQERAEVNPINTGEVVAWKNGYFSFEEADLKTVMRQLSRWYDVEVVYEGDIFPETFTGKFQRNMSLSKVLDILTYAGIHFKMEGRKLKIRP